MGWSNWGTLGGACTSAPCVVSKANNSLDIFARGTDNAIWARWYSHERNQWSGWGSLGAPPPGLHKLSTYENGLDTDHLEEPPVVVSKHTNSLDLFVRAADNTLWTRYYILEENRWSDWGSLGGQLNSVPAVVSVLDNLLHVFAKGTDNALWFRFWNPENGWTDWESLGGDLASAPLAFTNPDDRYVGVYALGSDGRLCLWGANDIQRFGWEPVSYIPFSVYWAASSIPPVGLAPNSPLMLDSYPKSISKHNGSRDCFARGADKQLWIVTSNFDSNRWNPLGGYLTSPPAAVSKAEWSIDVFARGGDNALWTRWWEPDPPPTATKEYSDYFILNEVSGYAEARIWEKVFPSAGSISGTIERINVPIELDRDNVDSVSLVKLGFDGTYYVTKQIKPGGSFSGADLEPFFTGDTSKKNSIHVTVAITFKDFYYSWPFGKQLGLTITYTSI